MYLTEDIELPPQSLNVCTVYNQFLTEFEDAAFDVHNPLESVIDIVAQFLFRFRTATSDITDILVVVQHHHKLFAV